MPRPHHAHLTPPDFPYQDSSEVIASKKNELRAREAELANVTKNQPNFSDVERQLQNRRDRAEETMRRGINEMKNLTRARGQADSALKEVSAVCCVMGVCGLWVFVCVLCFAVLSCTQLPQY